MWGGVYGQPLGVQDTPSQNHNARMHNSISSLHLPSLALVLISFPGRAFWPYAAGIASMLIGLAVIVMRRHAYERGPDRLTALGPLCFAFAMGVFGADHLIAAKFVAMGVPKWMPFHLFWAYFVGFALLASALSLATGVQRRLACSLLGSMIFLFVLTIHIPSLFARPFDPTRVTIVLRDLFLSTSTLAFAARIPAEGRLQEILGTNVRFRIGLITAARLLAAIVIAEFGVNNLLHAAFVPGIPQENPTTFIALPASIPWHSLWSRLVGTLFIACAIGMLSRRHARLAVTTLGGVALVLAAVVYLPLTIARVADIANGLNYLAIHFALAGGALLLAQALPANRAARAVSEPLSAAA